MSVKWEGKNLSLDYVMGLTFGKRKEGIRREGGRGWFGYIRKWVFQCFSPTTANTGSLA